MARRCRRVQVPDALLSSSCGPFFVLLNFLSLCQTVACDLITRPSERPFTLDQICFSSSWVFSFLSSLLGVPFYICNLKMIELDRV